MLQAAARNAVTVPLMCMSGNPTSAGWTAVRRLIGTGAVVRYHGDFDWPGIAIAARLYALGAGPWRMFAKDYRAAVDSLPVDRRIPLTGDPVPTTWDENLATAMGRANVAVHEESEYVLHTLVDDLVRAATTHVDSWHR